MARDSDRRETGNARGGAAAVSASGGAAAKAAADRKARQQASSAASKDVSTNHNSLVGADWFYLAPCMALSLILAAMVSGVLPGLLASAFALAAIAIVAFTPLWLRYEYLFGDSTLKRWLFMHGMVGFPMAFFGAGLAVWMSRDGSLSWTLGVGIMLMTSTAATATLAGRLPSIVTGVVALWVAIISLTSPGITAAVSICSIALGGYLTVRYCRERDEEDARRGELERTMHRAEDLLAEYEQSGQGWFWETDRKGLITYVSPIIARLLGSTSEGMVGKPFMDMFVLDGQEKEGERTLNFHLSTRSSFQELSVLAATGEQEERWWSITGRPVLDQFHNFLGFRGSGTDLTETKKSQRHVTQLARFDSLTKLANRFQMSEWLEKILSSPREENRACAVFLLDLDRFKQVNDTMGHPAGDALLRQVADRLRSTVAKTGSVGRLGGDEFQVIIPGRIGHADLGNLAMRIIENLSQPYSIEGQRVIIGASVGISTCPDHGTTSEALIRNADLALYAAKDGGRGRHHFYADDLHNEAEERVRLEQELRDAISSGDLELQYQPQVHTTTEKISGFEALLRWNHPRLGYISPAKFIPVAEDAGLIAAIGEWALRTACRDLATWPEEVRVAVNVSPLQFSNPALPAIVTSAIAEAQVSPERLELEITESVFLTDDKSTESMFAALKRVGVRLALDDFGTGYSSLGYLRKAPFDKIKIDQSFVRGATVSGSRHGAIISSIVNLAESLGMETTAEGVETLDELDLIRSLGCSHIQGFIYEKPLDAQSALERLQSGLSAIAKGPKSARAARQTMLRKVLLEHGAHKYQGMIRNVSVTGALIEGLWNVPPGTEFKLHLSKGYAVQATARWSKEDRMGIEFAQPLELDDRGAVSFVRPRYGERDSVHSALLRKAG